MINMILRGGVANQMSIFAAGYSFAKKHKTGLILDVTNYKTDNMRKYSLGLFGGIRGRYEVVTDSLVDICETGLPYNQQLIDNVKYDSCIKGYFQCEKYFVDYAQDLFKIFTPYQPLTSIGRDTLREIQEAGERSVFLTIRRTDYLNSDFHGVLPHSYYEEALKYISYFSGIDNLRVFTFSDDMKWCEENFIGSLPYEMSLNGNYDMTTRDHLGREDEELYLMQNCANAVCANSSYSFWGAWLGDVRFAGKKRIVVAPRNWFGKSCPEDSRDIVPERWTKI